MTAPPAVTAPATKKPWQNFHKPNADGKPEKYSALKNQYHHFEIKLRPGVAQQNLQKDYDIVMNVSTLKKHAGGAITGHERHKKPKKRGE